jgi:hypothetical protein
MAKVLVFNNFLKKDQDWLFAVKWSKTNEYRLEHPGRWRGNPAGTRKHENARDYVFRLVCSARLWRLWRQHDVLIVESCLTGLLMAAFSCLGKGRRKLMIVNFNVPRHRKAILRFLSRHLFRRVDHYLVHSQHDIEISGDLYGIPAERFTFWPYVRSVPPAQGEPDPAYPFPDRRPFIISYGSNARDYGTFCQALNGAPLDAIVVAREWNLKGITLPPNVRALSGIPMSQCDKLVSQSLFTVFPLDCTEPSCGQISIVTSLMLGKPVICTDWMGVRDYIEHGVNGLLVPPNDPAALRQQMLSLARDKDLYARLSRGALEWSKRHADPVLLQQKIDDLVTALARPNP